jgi:hypothetical protein
VSIVEDTLAISRLVYQFGYLLDKADFEGIADLFAHGSFGSAELGRGAYRGRDAVLEQFRRTSIPEGTARTKQIYSNLIVDVDDGADAATSMCNFVVYQATETLPLQAIVTGHFEDTFERVEGTWRFADRYIVVELVGNLSQRLYEGTQPYH